MLDDTQQQKLDNFLKLLEKWNKAFNLTAIQDIESMQIYHVNDSLSVAPFIHGKRILDVGTGAGFPGVPLSVCLPEKQFVLLDGNGKKTRFLTQAKLELALSNIEVVHSRVESLHTTACFDVIITRAVGSVADMLEKARHLICPEGRFLFMKGEHPSGELAEIAHLTDLKVETHKLNVPGLDASRHLIEIRSENAWQKSSQ